MEELINTQLLSQFSSITTDDHDNIIKALKSVIGNQIHDETCLFLLEMNNWNVQSAVGSYFEFIQPNTSVPKSSLVKHLTLSPNCKVPNSTSFAKSWKIQNSGSESWPVGCSLRHFKGETFSSDACIPVPPIPSGTDIDVSLQILTPKESGIYEGYWKLSLPNGNLFGDEFLLKLNVDENFKLENEIIDGLPPQYQQYTPASPRSSTSIPKCSSLPSSPRWYGDTSYVEEYTKNSIAFFQTPNNSPRKTIGSTLAKPNIVHDPMDLI